MKQMNKQKSSQRTGLVQGDKLNGLAETIEALRKEKFPMVPKDLVAKVLNIETEHVAPDDRHTAQAKLREVIEVYLERRED
jgi:hypothetical protein